jgi:hypothetical protein
MPWAGGNGGVKFGASRARTKDDGVAPGFAAVASREDVNENTVCRGRSELARTRSRVPLPLPLLLRRPLPLGVDGLVNELVLHSR